LPLEPAAAATVNHHPRPPSLAVSGRPDGRRCRSASFKCFSAPPPFLVLVCSLGAIMIHWLILAVGRRSMLGGGEPHRGGATGAAPDARAGSRAPQPEALAAGGRSGAGSNSGHPGLLPRFAAGGLSMSKGSIEECLAANIKIERCPLAKLPFS
jgi:hypothetical protein